MQPGLATLNRFFFVYFCPEKKSRKQSRLFLCSKNKKNISRKKIQKKIWIFFSDFFRWTLLISVTHKYIENIRYLGKCIYLYILLGSFFTFLTERLAASFTASPWPICNLEARIGQHCWYLSNCVYTSLYLIDLEDFENGAKN